MKALLLILLFFVGAFSLRNYPSQGGGQGGGHGGHGGSHYRGHGKEKSRHGHLQPVYDHARSNSCGSCAKPSYCPPGQVAVQVPPSKPYCCSPWVCQPNTPDQCIIDGVTVPDDGQQHNVNCKFICKCVNGQPQCVDACPPAVIHCDVGQKVVTVPPVPPACCPTQHCEPDVCYYKGFLLTDVPHQYSCNKVCTCDGTTVTCIPVPCGDPPPCGDGFNLVSVPPGPGECCPTWHCEPEPKVCTLPGGQVLQDGATNVQIGCQLCSCASGVPACIALVCTPPVPPASCPYGQGPITVPPVAPNCCPTITCG